MVDQQGHPRLKQHSNPTLWNRILWILMLMYILGFGIFAWQDLYSAQRIEGLYRTHHSPYALESGQVVDPKPQQTLHHEIEARTGLRIAASADTWLELKTAVDKIVVGKQARTLRFGELILARDAQDRLLLVVNKYRGNWIIFRPNIGVILSYESTDSLLKDTLTLKASEGRR